MAAHLQLLRPASHPGPPARRSVVYTAAKGRGVSVIAGPRFEWQQGDILVVPSWAWHRGTATLPTRARTPAVLLQRLPVQCARSASPARRLSGPRRHPAHQPTRNKAPGTHAPAHLLHRRRRNPPLGARIGADRVAIDRPRLCRRVRLPGSVLRPDPGRQTRSGDRRQLLGDAPGHPGTSSAKVWASAPRSPGNPSSRRPQLRGARIRHRPSGHRATSRPVRCCSASPPPRPATPRCLHNAPTSPSRLEGWGVRTRRRHRPNRPPGERTGRLAERVFGYSVDRRQRPRPAPLPGQ
ncbi:hypothetical protein KAURM247S_01888 [Kitasatospora aureofaciens]